MSKDRNGKEVFKNPDHNPCLPDREKGHERPLEYAEWNWYYGVTSRNESRRETIAGHVTEKGKRDRERETRQMNRTQSKENRPTFFTFLYFSFLYSEMIMYS